MKQFVAETPAGIGVRYTPAQEIEGKKIPRKYEVRGYSPWWQAWWRDVPSVTEGLEVLDKPGLSWWGMQVGIRGTLDLWSNLYSRGILGPAWEEESALEWLKQGQLTVNSVRDKAGDRGQAVHDAFELWATNCTDVDPSLFPEEQAGYARGLKQFLQDVDPEPGASEVMVGSVRHGFAGRYDVRFTVTKECQVVYKQTPKRGAHYATLSPGVYLADLKTSKGIYHLKHDRQLEAYELASVECGYEPTDARGVIHVSADGTYEFSRSTATAEDFLAVLEVWKSDQRMKARKRK